MLLPGHAWHIYGSMEESNCLLQYSEIDTKHIIKLGTNTWVLKAYTTSEDPGKIMSHSFW